MLNHTAHLSFSKQYKITLPLNSHRRKIAFVNVLFIHALVVHNEQQMVNNMQIIEYNVNEE